MNATVKKILKEILIIIAVLITIWAGFQIALGTTNPFYVVSSGSMIPALLEFDILMVSANEPFESVEVGDIIVFNRPGGVDRVIVHRVAAIIDDDPLTLRTKGDANPSSIPGVDFPITESEYLGTVIHVVPQAGYVTRILMPPINYIIIAAIMGYVIFRWYYKRKQKAASALEDKDSVPDAIDLDGNAQDFADQPQIDGPVLDEIRPDKATPPAHYNQPPNEDRVPDTAPARKKTDKDATLENNGSDTKNKSNE